MFVASPEHRSFACMALAAFLLLCPGLDRSRGQVQPRPLGTDVSGYQPSINWGTVKNAGVVFAWAKATEGTSYSNPYFPSQEAGAKSVGIYIGAYHYARPSSHPNLTGANSADSEAAYFWGVAGNYVKAGGSYLVPMLDWEDTGATAAAGFTAASLSAWVNEWCSAVSNYARLNGVVIKPVVYTGTWYSNPANGYPGLTTAVTIWPCWISAYPTNPNPQTGGPASAYPWPAWNIWQYANTNWSGGDSDVFNGTLAGFIQMFVIGGTNAPGITSNPASLSVGQGSDAIFSVTATGQAPLSLQWRFNGTAIPGATATSYIVAGAQLANAGGYSVVVTNTYGSLLSSTAFLSVLSLLTNAPGAILAPAGMVDWWPAEGNPNDLFGTNNATPYNGFSYTTGKQGLAFHFDGSTSYLAVPGAASLAPPWTACMWVNRQDAPAGTAALLSDGTYELKLEQYNTARQVGLTRFGVGDYTFGYTVPAGAWTHLAFVVNSTGTSLYVNGALRSTLTNALPLPRGYIGAGWVASSARFVDYMAGSLDELLLFNRALAGSEVQAIYATGASGLVRAPEFTGIGSLGNGQFRLSVRGQTGKSFTLYGSPDLATWSPLATIANPAGSTQYNDTSATNVQKFYRATQP